MKSSGMVRLFASRSSSDRLEGGASMRILLLAIVVGLGLFVGTQFATSAPLLVRADGTNAQQKHDGQQNQHDDGQRNQKDDGQRNQKDDGQQNQNDDGRQHNKSRPGERRPATLHNPKGTQAVKGPILPNTDLSSSPSKALQRRQPVYTKRVPLR